MIACKRARERAGGHAGTRASRAHTHVDAGDNVDEPMLLLACIHACRPAGFPDAPLRKTMHGVAPCDLATIGQTPTPDASLGS